MLEYRPIQQGSGCLLNKLESNNHICFPSFRFDRNGFEKCTIGSRFGDNNCSSMAETNMASKVTQNVCQEPNPSTNKLGPSSRLSRKLPAYDSTKLPQANDLDHHRENIQAEAISKRATALIKISKRNNSLKHFESTWGKWVS